MDVTKSKQQVSTMIKQGFISDYFLSPPPQSSPLPSPSSSPSDPTRTLQTPIRSTLFEMMTEEQTRHTSHLHNARSRIEERVERILSGAPFRNPSDWGLGFGDVKLTITGRDGFSVSMDVHRQVLVNKSQFFKEKLGRKSGAHHCVEICECEDVQVYLETLVLMYFDDPLKKMTGESVSKILSLLKVCAFVSIFFTKLMCICFGNLEDMCYFSPAHLFDFCRDRPQPVAENPRPTLGEKTRANLEPLGNVMYVHCTF